uniref:Uncharacterized protein n=1 Tax=Globisporangium ultimum (strain ATCC 200006 / CBS 805.95 / DAOM BR144) TaxID=431595 RepID=K3WQ27_GLOUD
MNESSVSPERCEVMIAQPAFLAMVTASILSVIEPIWFTLSKSALHAFKSMAFCTRVGFVTVRSSPTICTSLPTLSVNLTHDAQSSWSNGSSIDTIGLDSLHLAMKLSYNSMSLSAGILSESAAFGFLKSKL